MIFGTVRCYNCRTGLGWIQPDDGSGEIAVKETAVSQAGLGQLAPEQRLGFRIETRRKSRLATQLWATWSDR